MNQPTTNLPILPEDSAVCAAPALPGAPMTEVANPVQVAPTDKGCSCCGITEVGVLVRVLRGIYAKGC